MFLAPHCLCELHCAWIFVFFVFSSENSTFFEVATKFYMILIRSEVLSFILTYNVIFCTLHIVKMLPLKNVRLQIDDKMTKKQVMEEKIHAHRN